MSAEVDAADVDEQWLETLEGWYFASLSESVWDEKKIDAAALSSFVRGHQKSLKPFKDFLNEKKMIEGKVSCPGLVAVFICFG